MLLLVKKQNNKKIVVQDAERFVTCDGSWSNPEDKDRCIQKLSDVGNQEEEII